MKKSALAIAVSLSISVATYMALKSWGDRRDLQKLIFNSKDLLLIIEKTIEKDLEIIRSNRAFFETYPKASRKEFQKFTAGSLKQHPEFQALELMIQVPGNKRASIEKAARSDGFSDFQFKELSADNRLITAPKRSEYYILYYVEPIPTNRAILGYNIQMTPTANEALKEAIKNEIGVSRWLHLGQGDTGFVIYLMFPSENEKQRNFSVGVFRVFRLIEVSTASLKNDEVSFGLSEEDGKHQSLRQFHFDSVTKKITETEHHSQDSEKLKWDATLKILNKTWKFHFYPSDNFTPVLPQPLLILIVVGVLAMSLLGMMLVNIYDRNSRLKLEIVEQERNKRERMKLLAIEHEGRKKAESALLARDEFLTNASHELKTPLTPLNLLISFLKQSIDQQPGLLPKGSKLEGIVSNTDQQLNRLNSLVDSLIESSKIAESPMVLSFEKIDIKIVLQSVIERLDTELKRAHCEITLEAESGIIVECDVLRIERMFSNLLMNAMKFGAGNPIETKVRTNENLVHISVIDHGIGIAKEDQQKIFEKFERAVSSKNFGGFGMGLFVSQQITAAHKGKISVQSELGKGTTFTVELPLHQ